MILTLLVVFHLSLQNIQFREAVENMTGIGWSEEGITKFNELLDQVEHDRQERGGVFLHSFFYVICYCKTCD